ncbi:MAG: VCBS repeat-containing protein [Bacteroidia bacterium]|nr:VCBS repeat-containing protein [Bacteroidia bacterium]
MRRYAIWGLLAGMAAGLAGCGSRQDIPAGETLFTPLPAEYTGIGFVNQLSYDKEFNVYTYRNFYNGGGVGLGDINNDGLVDVYFCGNMVPSRLYLNKGNFQFEDITDQAGVACEGSWATGASFADINGDGLVDLYVCKSGKPEGRRRFNELFINNGDLTFTEQSEAYGLNDKGFSTHAAFFDYDKDGDLDCYLLNNSFRPIGGFDLRKNQRNERDSLGGNKLYRNDGQRFTDVSEEAGIYGSVIGFGLGVTIGDVNRDGWQDMYVSNDFFERDYLYLNNQDGTFTESLETAMREISAASMGADMADINNDGYPEVFVTDMLPQNDARMKTKTTFEDWNKYQLNLRTGYYHQFTRNVFQLNNGPIDTAGNVVFSEIGRMAGVFGTDWSWGALIMDLDNDGLKDLFVANGIYQDLTDQDFLNYASDPRFVQSVVSRDRKVDFRKLIEIIPSVRIPNYAFRNNGDLTFTDMAAAWGLGEPSHSNGTVYGDLDNDGDLDLLVSNVNMPPFVYRNEARSKLPDHHYLQFSLAGEGKNTQAIGTQIEIRHQGQVFYTEQMPMRGFQSTMDHRPIIGLGNIRTVDTVLLRWPDLRQTVLTQVPADQMLALSWKDAVPAPPPAIRLPEQTWLTALADSTLIPFRHRENEFKDFDRDRLLYHMLSSEGPRMCSGDVNGDGLTDLYIGNAKDSPGSLLLQRPGGRFEPSAQPVFAADQVSEDIDCLFFDADRDGDLDLLVASGGSELPSSSSGLLDRLYLNDGRGNFTKSQSFLLSGKFESTSALAVADYDRDGDLDIFAGSRLVPFAYGQPASGFILQNDGRGNFRDVTDEAAPVLKEIGMITDALWLDLDRDQDPDLVLCGEYMPITVLINEGGKLSDQTEAWGLKGSNGFWQTLEAADLDGDGDLDLVAGNHGLNSRFKADAQHPVCMHVSDFDRNGTQEHIICVYEGEKSYPLALRHDLVMQMPALKRKYLKYENYQNQTIEDIFTPEERAGMRTWYAYELRSSLLLNEGGRFARKPLPQAAQLSPVYAALAEDLDGDGRPDLVLGGNFFRAKPEVGGHFASYGLVLKGLGQGEFQPVRMQEAGMALTGEVRDLGLVRVGKVSWLVAVRNDAPVQVYELNRQR